MAEEKTVYEIRRDGVTVCASSLPMLGYSVKRLRGLLADGYRYYAGGKLQRKIEAAEAKT